MSKTFTPTSFDILMRCLSWHSGLNFGYHVWTSTGYLERLWIGAWYSNSERWNVGWLGILSCHTWLLIYHETDLAWIRAQTTLGNCFPWCVWQWQIIVLHHTVQPCEMSLKLNTLVSYFTGKACVSVLLPQIIAIYLRVRQKPLPLLKRSTGCYIRHQTAIYYVFQIYALIRHMPQTGWCITDLDKSAFFHECLLTVTQI